MEKFSITKVYTKNIVTDSFQGIRNIFGLRLRGYERMINVGTDELIKEMELKYNVKWYRLNINPLLKGSVMITIYGEGKKNTKFYDMVKDRPAIKLKKTFVQRLFYKDE